MSDGGQILGSTSEISCFMQHVDSRLQGLSTLLMASQQSSNPFHSSNFMFTHLLEHEIYF